MCVPRWHPSGALIHINDPVVPQDPRAQREAAIDSASGAFNAVEAIAVACGDLLLVSNDSAPLYTY